MKRERKIKRVRKIKEDENKRHTLEENVSEKNKRNKKMEIEDTKIKIS